MLRAMGLHSFPLGQRGSRHFNRLRLGVPAQLVLTHEIRKCLIDDISASGARLRILQRLADRQAAQLSLPEPQLLGTAVWRRGGRCGVRARFCPG